LEAQWPGTSPGPGVFGCTPYRSQFAHSGEHGSHRIWSWSLVVRVGGVLVGVGVGDGLGQVLGEVAHGAVGVLAAGEDALDVDLAAEGDHVRRLGVGVVVDVVEDPLPRGERVAGVGVAVVPVVPERGAVLVDDGVHLGPPQRHVGGGGDGLERGPGDRAAQGDVEMRGEAHLGLDGAEVLHPVAGGATQVLEPAVHQLGEVQGIQRRPSVVVTVRADRNPASPADFAVAVEGEGDEHGGPVGIAARGGEDRADGSVLPRTLRQVRHACEAAGGPAAPPGRPCVLIAVFAGGRVVDFRC
jgi:hypothetical protein